MEKLIELLNEYEKDGLNEFEKYTERWYCERTYQILSGKWENNNELKPCEIISKSYGFIQWLVENEKIDLDEFSIIDGFDDYESLLMRLAIDDEPLEFLASILK